MRRKRPQLGVVRPIQPPPSEAELISERYKLACAQLGDMHVHRRMLDARIEAKEAELLELQRLAGTLPAPPEKGTNG